jgi:hypothetical protein
LVSRAITDHELLETVAPETGELGDFGTGKFIIDIIVLFFLPEPLFQLAFADLGLGITTNGAKTETGAITTFS